MDKTVPIGKMIQKMLKFKDLVKQRFQVRNSYHADIIARETE